MITCRNVFNVWPKTTPLLPVYGSGTPKVGHYMYPGCLCKSYWVFFPDPWLLVCGLSTFAAIIVNLTLAASQPTLNLLLLGKTSLSEFYLKHTGVRGLPNLFLVAHSLLFPESVKIYSYKFQTKFWINKLLLYLDESPYIVFIFKIDAQTQPHYLFTHSTIVKVSP